MATTKKKEETRIEKVIANTVANLDLLKSEYSEKPTKTLSSIIVAQELSLMEMKQALAQSVSN